MDAQATFSCSFTQSDIGPAAELPNLPLWPAQRLLPQERQELAVKVLAGAQPVAELAQEHEVSRKFLYQQAGTAREALDPCLQTRTEGRGCSLLPPRHQGVVASIGPRTGVGWPRPVSGRCRAVPRPL